MADEIDDDTPLDEMPDAEELSDEQIREIMNHPPNKRWFEAMRAEVLGGQARKTGEEYGPMDPFTLWSRLNAADAEIAALKLQLRHMAEIVTRLDVASGDDRP